MRRIALLLLATSACSKEPPKADSVSVGATTTAATAALTPTDTARVAVAPPTRATQRGATAPPTDDRQETARRPGAGGDVIMGRIGGHGADAQTFLAITPASGAQIRVAGSQITALGAVRGADIWARGRRDGDEFIVDTFEVKRANEQPVEDGIVSVSGTTVTVRTARGTVTYPEAPIALRNADGARVWITPPAAGQTPFFGIIRTTTKQVRR